MISSGATPVINLGELILRGTSTKVETVKDADGNILEKGRANGAPEDIRCGEPLYQKSRLRRWPLADYIAKQAKGHFQTLICDEVHKSKGGDTDIEAPSTNSPWRPSTPST